MIGLDDAALIFGATLCLPHDDERAVFFGDCMDLLRGLKNITTAEVREAILEASRLWQRRRAAA
jgi:hypothetical protein